MRNKVVAFESANSFVKVFSHGRKSAIYANTLTRPAIESYNLEDQADTAAKKPVSDRLYTINGESFHAGRTTKYLTSSSDSVERYKSENYYRESLIAISQFANDGDTIIVATGIPSIHYADKKKATKYITEALKGEHTIGIDGEEITFTVKEVKVTLQPLATFFYTVIDEMGTSSPEMINRYEGTETLVVDIGWGTTDLALIQGSELMNYWTTETSMKTAYEIILQNLRLEASKNNKKLATGNISLLEIERQIRETKKVRYSNESYDVKKIFEKAMEQVASDILSEVNTIRGIDQYTTVIFTGGGSKTLYKNLESRLTDPSTDELYENIFFMDLNTAQFANVKGYYVFASYL